MLAPEMPGEIFQAAAGFGCDALRRIFQRLLEVARNACAPAASSAR